MKDYFIFGILFFLILSVPLALWIRSYLLRQKSGTSQEVSPGIDQLERGISHFIEMEDHKIHLQVHGKGKKTLVLLHGIGASLYTWRFVVPRLAEKYQVLVLDLPGFGKSSMRPEFEHDIMSQSVLVDSLLKKLGLKKSILVGSSMGGTIAMWMASLFPDSYENIVLISPAIEPKLAKLLHLPSIRIFTKPMARLIVNKLTIRQMLQLVCANRSLVNEESVDIYYSPYKNNTNAVLCFLKAAEILKDPDLWINLKLLKSNILLVWGRKDLVTPISGRKKIIERYRGQIQSETCEAAGHHVMEDEPDWLVDSILRYLRS